MTVKKYNFNKILSEYNKIYKQKYKLQQDITKAVIVHKADGTFDITYVVGLSGFKNSLSNFVFYNISVHSPVIEDIRQIILLKEEKKMKLKIEIWPSNKIRYAYLDSNYIITGSGGGNLGNSCMRHTENQRALNFYIKNKVKIVVVINNKNKVYARALLWSDIKTIKNKKVITYLDKVYPKSDTLIPLFDDLVKENKWSYYRNSSVGEERGNLYKDNLDLKEVCHLPYTDTFRYLYYKDNVVTAGCKTSSLKLKYPNARVNLTHTGDGGYFPQLDPNRTVEALTNNLISKKDAVFVKRYDGFVLKVHIVDIKGTYYSQYDKKLTETKLDGWIFTKNSVNEVITNEPIDKTKAVNSEKYKGHIHKSNAVDIKGILYHKKDADIICFNNKYYHISQCFINYDRKEVNKELAKQPVFFYKDLSETWLSWWGSLKEQITRKEGLIPKELATVAYNLAYNATLDVVEHQEVYFVDKIPTLKLTTGELVVDSTTNRKLLKKFNNKWYIKQEFKLRDKNQLTFSFMRD